LNYQTISELPVVFIFQAPIVAKPVALGRVGNVQGEFHSYRLHDRRSAR